MEEPPARAESGSTHTHSTAAAAAPRTVLLGCSFSGLALLGQLVRARGVFRAGEMTVVEPRTHHSYLPLAHEAVGDDQSLYALRLPLEPHLASLGARWHACVATRVDAARRVVHLEGGTEVEYDRLVIAVGGERDVPEDIRSDGRVMPAREVEDALAIRQRLRVLHATRSGMVRVVVVGAGPSGVEWSAALASTRIDGARVTVTLIERAQRILPDVHYLAARRVRGVLGELRVEVLAGRAVRTLDGDRLVLDEGIAIPFDVAVWTAGVRPPPLIRTLGFPCTPDGHLAVTPRLAVAGAGQVYAAGAVARVVPPEGRSRNDAQYTRDAIHQGVYLARRLSDGLPPESGAVYKAKRTLPCPLSLGARRGVIVYGAQCVESRIIGVARRAAAALYLARLQRAAARSRARAESS